MFVRAATPHHSDCNIASLSVLKHLNAAELARASDQIRAHGHEANIRMLETLATWAKSNPFIRR